MSEFCDKLEEAAAILRRLAACARDAAEARSLSAIAHELDDIIEQAKANGLCADESRGC